MAIKIITRPPAPKHGQVNDASDTFDWQLVRGFTHNTDYEYSLDSGKTWTTVIRKPIVVGNWRSTKEPFKFELLRLTFVIPLPESPCFQTKRLR
uniref:hypothetical protein n=1 Tax=Vibrio sp. SBT000027 TaxID=1803384 RepID=UPI00217EA5DB|nr:hypothetical protein [Vibrio sp. SBT000027]